MQILLTRPREDSERLAETLSARGHSVLIEPLLAIRPDLEAPLDLDGVQALLLTSANGARAFALRSASRDLPVLAVGDTTAAAAREFGFARVESAGGNVEDLARLVRARLRPEDGVLLHASGSAVAGDLAGALETDGYAVRRAVLYHAEPVQSLSEAAIAALRDGGIDLVVIFSPRTAATFAELAQAAGLEPACARTALLGLSPAVIEAAAALPWRARLAATEPTEAALIDAIDRHAAERETAPMDRIQKPTDPAAPAAPARASARGWAPVAAAILLALAALGWTAWHALRPPPAPDLTPVALLEQRLAALERDMAARSTALEREAAAKLAALERDLAGRIAALEPRGEAERRSTAQADRLGAIEGRLNAVAADAQKLAARLDGVEQEPRSTADPGRLAMLMNENRRLGQELARLQEEVAAVNATLFERAETRRTGSLALALGQLREALARGRPFAPELATARALAGDDAAAAPALASLEKRAERGVPTRDSLTAQFEAVAGDVMRAAQSGGPEAWWRPLWNRVSGLVSLRPVGEVAGSAPAAIVARAERRLAAGDLAAAVAELEALQGRAAEPARRWLAEAHGRLSVEAALSRLTAQALRPGAPPETKAAQ